VITMPRTTQSFAAMRTPSATPAASPLSATRELTG
jgi:hypothetical protein